MPLQGVQGKLPLQSGQSRRYASSFCTVVCPVPKAAKQMWGALLHCMWHSTLRPQSSVCVLLAEARNDGADSAVLLRATWRDTRRAVLRAGGVADFTFRQYLFACQARVLLRLGRPQEVRCQCVNIYLNYHSC